MIHNKLNKISAEFGKDRKSLLSGVSIQSIYVLAAVFDQPSSSYIATMSRFLSWREEKGYRKLKGLKGVPTSCQAVDRIALVVEEISGRNVERLGYETPLSKSFFDGL